MLAMTRTVLTILLAMTASAAHAKDSCTFSSGQFDSLHLNSGHGKFLVIQVTRSNNNRSILREVCNTSLEAAECLPTKESGVTLLFIHAVPEWIAQYTNPIFGYGWNQLLNSQKECEIARSEFAILATERAHAAIAANPEEQKRIRESVYQARPW